MNWKNNISKYKKSTKIVILTLCIVLIFFTIYVGKIFYIKNYGIHIKPASKVKLIQVNYYLQNDKDWSNEKLGKTNYTIGSHGCLLSVIASTNSQLNQKVNPKELNNIFTKENIYTSSGDVIWYKIQDTIPELEYSFKRIFSGEKITNDLQNNKMPIVKVRYKKTGIFHWVLIVGATENDFLIFDPLNKDKKYTELYKTHGKVYSYREIHLKNN